MRYFKNTNYLWKISLFAGILFLLSANTDALAQTGAGGVGTNDGTSNLELWLDANELGLNNGDGVATWSDLSGNSNDATQSTAGNQPTFTTNQVNGLPTLNFDGSDDAFQITNPIDVTEATLFFVANKTGGTGAFRAILVSKNQLVLSNSNDVNQWGAWYNNSSFSTSFNPSGITLNTNFRLLTHLQTGTPTNPTGFFTTDGANKNNMRSDNTGFQGKNITTLGANSNNISINSQFFNGNISEVIYYGRDLNLAERIVVNSYLGNKYGLSTTGTEIKPFAFAGTHGTDISGIGQATDGSNHTASQSDFLELNSPTALANDEFLLFGHDDADASTWTTTELGTNVVERIAREWRLDETGTDVGNVTFTLNSVTSGLPAPDAGNTYYIVTDVDGDFTTTGDQSIAEMVPGTGDTFTASGVDINDGDYITIGQAATATNVAPVAATSIALQGVESFNGGNGLAVININDFQFSDGNNGDQIESVKVTSLPASGTLFLDANDNNTNDATESIAVNDDIQRSDIVNSRFKYVSANTTTNLVSFNFSVSDGQASSGTAQMFVGLNETDVTISGTEGWRFLTNPYGTAFNDLTSSIWTQGMTGSDAPTFGSDNIITFDETTESFATPSDISTSLGAGLGTAVFVFTDDDGNTSGIQGGFPKTLSTQITALDEITTGEVDLVITNTDGNSNSTTDNNEGWNLIGNPYGTAIDVDTLLASLDQSVNALNQNVYIWDNSTNQYTVLAEGNANTVAPFQSFFIRALTSGDVANATLDDNIRTSNAASFQKSVEKPLISLSMENDELHGSFEVAFRNRAQKGLDIYDAFQLSNLSSDYAELYSTIGDQRIARSVLPTDISEAIEIPLYTNTTVGGTFTVQSSLANVPSGWTVEIQNVNTGEITELSDGSTFTIQLPEVQGKRNNADQSGFMPTISSAADGDKSPQLILSVRPGTFTSVEDPLDNTPKNFELSQNFPNPFNPSTQIQFQLPQRASVNLTVYDLMGREVATLVNETRAAGQHTVTFDASRLSSGVYLYRLDAGSQVFTKKMILIK